MKTLLSTLLITTTLSLTSIQANESIYTEEMGLTQEESSMELSEARQEKQMLKEEARALKREAKIERKKEEVRARLEARGLGYEEIEARLERLFGSID